jgi:hypothetical protein
MNELYITAILAITRIEFKSGAMMQSALQREYKNRKNAAPAQFKSDTKAPGQEEIGQKEISKSTSLR